MSHSLSSYSINQLIQGCRAESQQTRQNEAGYCFELFRRAFEEKDEYAWEAIQQQYLPLLKGWIRVTSRPNLTENDVEDLSQEALTKFWHRLTKQDLPLKTQFEHVGGVLKYLKQCAVTAVFDFHRRQGRERRLYQQLTQHGQLSLGDVSTTCLDAEIEDELLQTVQQWVQLHLTDFGERLLVRLAFEQGLSAQQIVKAYPQHFATVNDVYRIKERVLKRARRSMRF